MTFTIELGESVPDLEPGDSAVYGSIVIDDFQERFHASTTYWSKDDYVKQWVAALEDITGESKKNSSALVASMYDPSHANFIVCWALYREGDAVFVQNRILMLNELTGEFDIKELGQYVGERKTITDDGDKISEWTTSVDALQECLRELRNA